MAYIKIDAEIDSDEVLDELSVDEIEHYLKKREGKDTTPSGKLKVIALNLFASNQNAPQDIYEFLDCLAYGKDPADVMTNYKFLTA